MFRFRCVDLVWTCVTGWGSVYRWDAFFPCPLVVWSMCFRDGGGSMDEKGAPTILTEMVSTRFGP